MKLVRYSKDVYQILDDRGVVAFLALRLTSGKWGAYDSNDNRLTKLVFETPKDVLSYIADRAALEKENAGMKIEWLGDDEAIVTLHWSHLLGLITGRERSYRGSCTVWHDAVTGKRQPTHIEMALSEIWTAARWKRDAEQRGTRE